MQVFDFWPQSLASVARKQRSALGFLVGRWGTPLPRKVPLYMVSSAACAGFVRRGLWITAESARRLQAKECEKSLLRLVGCHPMARDHTGCDDAALTLMGGCSLVQHLVHLRSHVCRCGCRSCTGVACMRSSPAPPSPKTHTDTPPPRHTHTQRHRPLASRTHPALVSVCR
jgi:hypothetical protein